MVDFSWQIKKLEIWDWGLVTDSERVTWTAFAILSLNERMFMNSYWCWRRKRNETFQGKPWSQRVLKRYWVLPTGADGALTNNKDRLSKCSLIESRVLDYIITAYVITIILCFMPGWRANFYFFVLKIGRIHVFC